MKVLYIVRHAEAAYRSGAGDHGRPLTPRGEGCARELGAMLTRLSQAPDQVLCSDAERAATTAALARAAGGWTAELERASALYLAPPAGLMDAARAAHGAAGRLALVAHQPGLSEWLGQLIGATAPPFAPASVARVDLDIESWAELRAGRGSLRWLVKPGEAPGFLEPPPG